MSFGDTRTSARTSLRPLLQVPRHSSVGRMLIAPWKLSFLECDKKCQPRAASSSSICKTHPGRSSSVKESVPLARLLSHGC
jgi:hypothetical protein